MLHSEMATEAEWREVITALLARIEATPNGWLNGEKIFMLHDTFGMPFVIIRDACDKRGAHFDESGIRSELRVAYEWDEARIEAELRDL